jgi:ABC-type branched-subunit amino acid transport system ATPase component
MTIETAIMTVETTTMMMTMVIEATTRMMSNSGDRISVVKKIRIEIAFSSDSFENSKRIKID